jgi:hypothetical protein
VPAYVIVQWAPGSRMPTTRTRTGRGRELARVLERHRATVLSDSGADETGAGPTTTLQVSDMAAATELATVLRGLDGVESAYPKPAEELP